MKLTQIQEEHLGNIETINCIDMPSISCGSMTSYEYCPNCSYGGLFKVYVPYREIEARHSHIVLYESLCPECKKEFDIIDIHELD